MKRALLAALLLICRTVGHAASGDAAAGDPGHLYYERMAEPQLDRYTPVSPSPDRQRWFRTHFFRMGVFEPYFDSRTSWYPHALVYINLYGVPLQWPVVHEHPEWILHDARGMLYIPWGCSGGTCPQYAGDIGNPAFRAWWIAHARSVMAHKYLGLWLDDVNMEFRVSDGTGKQTPPIDSNTGRPMTWEAWRSYVSVFVEEIRQTFPKAEILHNAIWFAGPEGVRDADPAIRRQIAAANNIHLERGIASDQGLTGGNGQWSLSALFAYIDRVHATGAGVTLGEFQLDNAGRQYALAGYFLISNGSDRLGDAGSNPDNWWSGFDVELGQPLGNRTWKDGVFERRFTGGLVLLGEPAMRSRTIQLPGKFRMLDGSEVTSVNLSARQGFVLTRADQK